MNNLDQIYLLLIFSHVLAFIAGVFFTFIIKDIVDEKWRS